MDLIKLDLEKLEFRRTLEGAEGLAITTRTRDRSRKLRGMTALVAGMGGMVLTMLPLMALTFLAMSCSIFLGILSALAMFLACLASGMYGFTRYLEPDDRLLLPTLLEPQAKAFFQSTADRRERLLDEAEAFDLALGVFKGLPERAGDEVNEGIAVNFSERRARLAAEQEAYLAELAAAAAGDRARVAAIEAARKNGKPRSPRRRELSEFADKVRQLAWVERSLEGLDSRIESGVTVDLSPYVAAQRLRAELEEEREALVARGLKPKKLPGRRAGPKLLPSAD